MADHRLLFSKDGRARYISHLDLMRTFQRAFFRAGIPIRHTEGFNPHPFISIALPLSLGYSSQCEILVFGLTGDTPADEVPARLNRVLPEGVRVQRCYEGGRPIRELAFLRYAVNMEYDGAVPAGAQDALRELLGRESLVVRRKSRKAKCGYTEVDLIPRVRQWELSAGDGALTLDCVLAAQNPGLNPELIVAALREEYPELSPDFVRFHRREALDADLAPFR